MEVIPSMECQRKVGKSWETTWASDDKATIYEKLANALVSKKINQCSYIKSIKRIQHYTHVEIIVTQDNGYRSIYKVNAVSF
jgi:hypothetical protein